MTQYVKSLKSIPQPCSTHKLLGRYIAGSEVPERYRRGIDQLVTQPALPFSAELGRFLFGLNGIACVSGPTQLGKTSALAAIVIYGVAFLMDRQRETGRVFIQSLITGDDDRRIIRPNDRYRFYDSPRTFRSMRKMDAGEDDDALIFRVRTVLLDDLDKVEPQYRPIVRDVIVHRQQNGLNTLVSVTNPAALRDFDPQVYRRIEDGLQIVLKANSGALLRRPARNQSPQQ